MYIEKYVRLLKFWFVFRNHIHTYKQTYICTWNGQKV